MIQNYRHIIANHSLLTPISLYYRVSVCVLKNSRHFSPKLQVVFHSGNTEQAPFESSLGFTKFTTRGDVQAA